MIQNRRRLADALELPFEAFIFGEQVHGSEVQVVTAQDKGKGRTSREDAIQARDGFVTNERGIILCTLYADCVPLYFYDPVQQAIGLAHAGWKGTVLQISLEAISAMAHTFGSRPEHLYAAIGPSIGPCCYEVDARVISQVNEVLRQMDAPPETREQVYTQTSRDSYQLNLQALNRILMLKAGILSSRIEVTQLCTSCASDTFFSHRKEGGHTGRMAAWIALLP